MSKWIILGAGGMLGQEFVNLSTNHQVQGLNKSQCDVSSISDLSDSLQGADVIVNCAAWTAVDDAEIHEDEAFQLNAVAAENIAKVSKQVGAKLVHISTDYVFSGDANFPYAENAPTHPRSAYGRTKLAGEKAVTDYYSNGSYIVRTAWLYGKYGSNFVKTMASLEAQKDEISVVADQFGQPTWTFDLAKKIIELVDNESKPGIYHGTSSGQTSWHEFAQKIFTLIGADPNRVKKISSPEFLRPAPRPFYSVLGHENWKSVGIDPIRNWEEALTEAITLGDLLNA